jgi:hypothetical protein
MFKITFNAQGYFSSMPEESAQLTREVFDRLESSHGVEVHRIDRVTRLTRDGQVVPVEGLYDLQLANGVRVNSALATDLIVAPLTPSVQG